MLKETDPLLSEKKVEVPEFKPGELKNYHFLHDYTIKETNNRGTKFEKINKYELAIYRQEVETSRGQKNTFIYCAVKKEKPYIGIILINEEFNFEKGKVEFNIKDPQVCGKMVKALSKAEANEKDIDENVKNACMVHHQEQTTPVEEQDAQSSGCCSML